MVKKIFLLLMVLGAGRAHAQPALSLEEAVARARASSQEVGLARAGVAAADAQVRAALAARLPQLDGAVNYSRAFASPFGDLDLGIPDSLRFEPDTAATLAERVRYLERNVPTAGVAGLGGAFGSLPFGRAHTYTAGFTAGQTLFSGGRIGAGARIARAGRDAARFALVEESAEVELQVRRAYWQTLLARELESIAAAALEQAEAFLAQERLRRTAGRGSDLEVLRAEVSRDNLRPQLVEARNAASLALLELQRLVDLPLGSPLRLTTPLSTPAADELERAEPDAAADLRRRAAVAAAGSQVAIREGQLRLARAAFLPAVQLQLNYGRQLQPSDPLRLGGAWQTDATAALSVQLPVFDGFRRDAEVAGARAELERARLELARTREAVELQFQQARSERERARSSIVARRATVELAERVYRLTVLRYEQGVATQLEVSQARLELLQSRTNLAQAIADFRIADAGLARASQDVDGAPLPFGAPAPVSNSTPR